jgi:hypothetical protein
MVYFECEKKKCFGARRGQRCVVILAATFAGVIGCITSGRNTSRAVQTTCHSLWNAMVPAAELKCIEKKLFGDVSA